MRLEWILGVKWLQVHGKGRAVTWTVWAALAGTALGVAAMVTSLAVMNGYRHNLVQVMAGALPHVSVSQLDDWGEELQTAAQRQALLNSWLENRHEVVQVSLFSSQQALLSGPQGFAGVLLRGVRPSDVVKDTSLLALLDTKLDTELDAELDAELDTAAAAPHTKVAGKAAGKVAGKVAGKAAALHRQQVEELALQLGEPAADGTRPIWFSRSLGTRLGVRLGDRISVLDIQGKNPWLPSTNVLQLQLVGWLDTGVSAFDEWVAVVALSTLKALFPLHQQPPDIGLQFAHPLQAKQAAQWLRSQLADNNYSASVFSWLENNQSLFTIIQIQKVALFFILFLIVAVALFGMAAALSMLVRDKQREIAILSSLGTPSHKIQQAFLFQGACIGISGLLLGILLGLAFCWALGNWAAFSLPPGIYPGSSQVPVLISWWDFLGVSLAVLTASLLGAWLPAKQAAAIQPVDILRAY